MTVPYNPIDDILAGRTPTPPSGGVGSSVDSIIPRTPVQVAPIYNNVGADEDGLFDYIGQLGRMYWHGIRQGPFREVITDNDRQAILNKIEEAKDRTVNYFSSVSQRAGIGGILPVLGRDVVGSFSSGASDIGQMVAGVWNDPKEAIPGLVRGMLEEFVEPMITLQSGEKVVDGEIVPATSEEVAQGVTTTLGNIAAGGIYTKLAGASATLGVGSRLSASSRMGILAQNMGREIVAQGVASAGQEIIARPEEASLETVVRNIGNPINLFMGSIGGTGRTVGANSTARASWRAISNQMNPDATIGIPSAKQVAVTQYSPLKDATAAMDAVTEADNWIQAGVRKIQKAGDGIFYVTTATQDEMRNVVLNYASDVAVVKPTTISQKLPISQTKSGTAHYFASDFDNLVYQSNDLAAVAAEYNMPLSVVKDLRNQLDDAVKKARVERTQYGKNEFRYKNIPEAKLPEVVVKPRSYVAADGTVLFSMKPLLPEQLKVFQKSGFLPNERVSVNGIERTVIGVLDNGDVRVRSNNGTVIVVDRANVQHMGSGGISVWGKNDYLESMVDRFLSFADSQSRTGSDFFTLVERFATLNKWNKPGDAMNFEAFVYRSLESRFKNRPIGPLQVSQEARWVKGMEDVVAGMEVKRTQTQRSVLDRMVDSGYRIVPDGPGWAAIDIEGRKFTTFNTIDELMDFARADFIDPAVPTVNWGSTPGQGGLGLRGGSQGWFADAANYTQGKWMQLKGEYGPLFRSMQRRVEDFGEAVGAPAMGAQVGRMMENLMNGINAAENGVFKPLMLRANKIGKLSEKLSSDVKIQITRALEQRSLDELRADMTPDQIITAEAVFETYQQAGGVQRVKKVYKDYIDGNRSPKILENVDPQLRDAVLGLDKVVREGLLKDEKLLRYIDALDAPKDVHNLTAEDLIKRYNWSREARQVYDEAKLLYQDAESLFQIPERITGYAPWLQKWEGIDDIFKKVQGPESAFVHELQRLGITPEGSRIMEIDDLVYRYVKAGIHHKSPTNMGVTSGELLSQINKAIDELDEMGRSSNVNLGIKPELQKWVMNLRGVPDPDVVHAEGLRKMVDKIFNRRTQGNAIDSMMNLVTLTKLTFRPIMAARDLIGSYGVALGYGVDAANEILNITPDRLRQIERLSQAGDLPQFSADEILSRTGRGKLSKAVDIGMRVSLQPQVYKLITGNMYIHTYNKVIAALRKAKGSKSVVIEELGDLLDGGSRASQEFFLETAVTDPISAAKFLAARNAHNVANRFGRMNNPMAWQGKWGRAVGQFGSWSLNASTTMGEMFTNSRSTKAAAYKMARIGLYSSAVALAGQQAGVKLYNWIPNPLTMLIGPGPLVDILGSFSRGTTLMMSPDESDRNYGWSLLERAGGSMLSPLVLKDFYESAQVWNETGDFYKASMRGIGFRLIDEE